MTFTAHPIARAVAELAPKATLLVHVDPLQGDPVSFEVPAGRTIASLLPAELAHEKVVCRYEGLFILRADWQRPVAPGEVVEFHVRPQGGDGGSDPLRTILTIALIVVAAVYAPVVGSAFLSALGVTATAATTAAVGSALIMIGGQLALAAVLPAQQINTATGTPETSPTYNTSLSGNQARIEGCIPDLYGYNRTYPDFAAQSYIEHDNDTSDQIYHAILCLSHGEFTVPRIELDDTPIESFKSVEVTVLPPGAQPTIVHPAVVTAPEVSGQELAPGEYVGQYAASAAGTLATHLGFDLTFNGLGKVESDGSVTSVGVVIQFECRPIDAVGRSTGTWQTLATVNVAAAKASVVRRSFKYAVTPGRYKVRAVRKNPKDAASNVLNTCMWTGLRAYLQYTAPVFEPDCTHIQVRMRANEQLNGLTQRRIAVTSQRKLPTWSPSGGWTAPVETRSIAWALANKWRAPYGDNLQDSRIDLLTLYTLDQTWAARQDRFDYSFDGFTDSATADTLIAAAGRAAVIRRNGVRTVVRDESVPVPVTAYSGRAIRDGSWECAYDLSTSDSPDGYIVEYWSNQTWDWVSIDAPCPGVTTMQYPVRQRLLGVTGAIHAQREALYMAAKLAYRRRFPSWTTELQGVLPAFGSPVRLAPPLPGWGLSGDVVSWDAATLTLGLSEPPNFTAGATHYISLVRDDGSLTEPVVATAGGDANSVVLASAPDFALVLNAADRERPQFLFGRSEQKIVARMLGIEPQGVDSEGAPVIGMSAVVEDERVHTADAALLPVGGAVQDPIDLAAIVPDDENTGASVWVQDHSIMATGYDDVTVSIELRNNGGMGWYGPLRPGNYPNEWMLTTVAPAEAALYEVYATVETGAVDAGSAAIGAWLNLGTDRRWEVTNVYTDLHLQIRAVGTTEVLGDCVISLEPTSLGTPPGGGD